MRFYQVFLLEISSLLKVDTIKLTLSKISISTTNNTTFVSNAQGTYSSTQIGEETMIELTTANPTLPARGNILWNRTKKAITIPANGPYPEYKLPPNQAGFY